MSYILCIWRAPSGCGFVPLLPVSPALRSDATRAAPTAPCSIRPGAWLGPSKLLLKSSYFPRLISKALLVLHTRPVGSTSPANDHLSSRAASRLYRPFIFSPPSFPPAALWPPQGSGGHGVELDGRRALLIPLTCSLHADERHVRAERVTH